MQDTYFGRHLTMSEWASRAGIENGEAITREDAGKRARLLTLSSSIDLPVVRSTEFSAAEVIGSVDRYVSFAGGVSESCLYAARGRSRDDGRPVLRARAKTMAELTAWIRSLDDASSYTFAFEPHIEAELSTVFVVGEARTAGEAIEGSILALNSGNFGPDEAVVFERSEDEWRFSRAPSERLAHFVEDALSRIRVHDEGLRAFLTDALGARFVGADLAGYFEAISSATSGLIFIDYNRVIADDLPAPAFQGHGDGVSGDVLVEGQVGCTGHVRGRARVVRQRDEFDALTLSHDEILVCAFTDPAALPLIMTAAAVVTDIGGVLSHAAIVCRELGKPCVIGTGDATARIQTGDSIDVDATRGVVSRLNA